MTSSTFTTDTLVKTTEGLVRGRRVGDLVAWRGIPYAAPPVGHLRLRAPQPVMPWSGELDADEFGDAAVQNTKFTALRPGKYQPSSENCLTLNVLATPGTSGSRPVMVFIHGGAYAMGMSATGIYGGQSLVRRGDIVYVSINYRLGALGYLDFTQFSTPERPFDSNLGLRDQVAALEWVRRNIAEFGGDPDNVTVFGESAGANAVTTLMATPTAEGLFARAISESSAPGLVTTADRAAKWASDYISLLGAEPANAAEALSTFPAGALGKAGDRFAMKVTSETPGLHPFGPVIDGDFLPESPLDAFANGSAHRVPLIIGTNAREGTLFSKFLGGLPTDAGRISRMFALTDPAAEAPVTGAYPGYPAPDAAADLGGDLTFWKPSIELAQAHSAHAPTYFYRFDFAPRAMRWLGLDATHAFELFAVFDIADTLIGRGLTLPGDRRALRDVTDTVQRHWLHFAATGTSLASWPQYDTDRRATLVFDTVTTVQDDPRRERRVAWEGYGGYYGQGL
ncbi:carboxylesterase/lipase family protein [Rhodococcus marinonascens]|uniref:carboxylesterase/lipase family protein n=1 Tax=Rhodococcus marinonascens TaxID=38311 RepID=UPI0009344BD8|nr:carboxylesterase/lipase family protein [Rhodococcus marinonascens]